MADRDGRPIMKFEGLSEIYLCPAAIRPRSYGHDELKSIDLVARGLEMMFGLGHSDLSAHISGPSSTLTKELRTAWNSPPVQLVRGN